MISIAILSPFAEDAQRLISATRYCKDSGMDFTFVKGTNGDLLDLDGVPREGPGFVLTPRQAACYISHIRAITLFLHSDHDRALIVEDDWMPLRDIKEAIAEIPEGDFVTLHGLDFAPAPLTVIEKTEKWEKLMPPPIIAIAYVINKRFATLAYDNCMPIRGHVDHYFRGICIKNNLECYRPTTPAVTGAGFPSTLGH